MKAKLVMILILLPVLSQQGWAESARLQSVRTGEHKQFTRLIFEFQNTVQFEHPEIIGKGKFSVRFLECSTDLPPVITYETDSSQKVQSVAFIKNNSNVTATVTLSFPDVVLRAFSLSNPDCIIVDAYRGSVSSKDSVPQPSSNHTASSEVSIQPEAKQAVFVPEKAPSSEVSKPRDTIESATDLKTSSTDEVLELPETTEAVSVSRESPTPETGEPAVEPSSVEISEQNGPEPSVTPKEEKIKTHDVPDLSQIQEVTQGPNYMIGTGDVLFISVWKDEALTNQVVVLSDGTIAFPLIGEIQAAGKTVAELKAELEEKLTHFLPDPTLTVSVQQMNSMQIYIVGRVNRPGSYPLNTRLNVLQALSIAGGLNPFADRKKIKIFRNTGEENTIFQFNYDDVTKQEKLRQNIALKRGDIIVVP